MQLSPRRVALLLLFLYAHAVVASIVHARQDSGATALTSPQPTATARTTAALSTEQTGDNEASSAALSAIESSTRASAEPSTTAAVSTTALTDVPSAAVASDAATASSSASSVYSGHGLPLAPKLTPAIGISGAVLIIAGVIYTLIGIKNIWVQIGCSVGFLVALAITVLIEYVMNPPVTDAVQGAFFVAAFIPALLAAGVAYIFKDITEGLGCLLGGFCLSMWFLVLKSGGLITSSTGRAIFISVFSAVGWALSFSRYTRTYALIGCISFAGATATVLGIDCFSRAGLKEFWLYIWSLNDDTFPLSTNTYPITRGIRVEIACIVIITLLGLASQMKLWRVVRARREQRDALRRQKEDAQERFDEEVGKKIVEDTDRERAQWEAVYGDKNADSDHLDSGLGSEHVAKTSINVKEIPRADSDDSIEMYELEQESRGHSEAQLLSQYATPVSGTDDIQRIDGHGRPVPSSGYFNDRMSMQQRQDSMNNSFTPMDEGSYSGDSVGPSPRLSMTERGPPNVPLPFVVPTGNDSASELLEQQSVASIPQGPLIREDSAQRLSILPNSKRNSKRNSNTRHSHGTSEDDLITPAPVESDRASSIAATLDDMNEDVISLPALSRVGTPFSMLDQAHGPPGKEHEHKADASADAPQARDTVPREARSDRQSEALASVSSRSRSLTSSTDPRPSQNDKHAARKDRRQSRTSTNRDEEGSSSDNQARSRRSTTQSEIAHSGSLSDHLPDKLSKVMLTYRTNEWAKHVGMAEQPELESIPEPSSPGVMVDLEFKQAAETRQKTPDPPPQPEAKPERDSRDTPQLSQSNSYRQSLHRSTSSQSKNVPVTERPAALSRNSSSATTAAAAATAKTSPHVNLQRNSSASSLTGLSRSGSALAGSGTRGLRISSTPIVEQPSEETLAESRAHQKSPMPMPTNTLMSERDTRMRNRPAKMSFIAAPGQSPVIQAQNTQRMSRTPSAAASARSSQLEGVEETDADNMSLAQRRAMIQKNRQSAQRNSSYPSLLAQNFDSHQPKRESNVPQQKREQMFASWRGSLQQDQQIRQPGAQREKGEDHRSAMISERRNKEWAAQQQEINRQQLDMMIHEKMRTGQMQQLHRERLRRLQAGARTE